MSAASYVSTRGQAPAASLSQAIAAGLAPDGGLYVPAALPSLHREEFAQGTLADTAATLLQPFFEGDALAPDLHAICAEALDFPVPLRPLGDSGTQLMELFHGPTAAFKDVGARFLAACLKRLRADADTPLTILVATSGDTGAAVAAAFHQVPRLRVAVLYPDGRVSPRQAHQLGCFGDNVRALRVAGSFDDCQHMVKAALGDTQLQAHVPMSSANSISLGRLLPQMSYYAHHALAWQRAHGHPLSFVVPTGNLGNALAALLVRAMGLPIDRVHLACNANDVIVEFLAGADYAPRTSVATLANAMDVGAPSNMERLRWLMPDDAALRATLSASRIDDARIRQTISLVAQRYGRQVCPHTACAIAAWQDLSAAGDTRDWALAATAHPAKFERIVGQFSGQPVPVPASLDALLARPAHAEPMRAETAVLARWLRDWH
ncbi:threonine synthase [Oleiagrimonas sp. C23AA]|uniref:threonine synthase n=1 Tax=Oleiagrimonas sp. C23AA TaxID=2719047 RepID=UPI00141D912E|nr:threonine synthase [Oleiagrimonas sp. C23AA]NII12254.1 threonine synthase [Oleiagrimonas sp. C23AA]